MAIPEFLQLYYPIVFILLSGMAAFIALRKGLEFPLRLFAWLSIFLSVMWSIAYIMAFNGIPNHFLFNIFDPLEFFFIPLFYLYQLFNPLVKKIIVIYLIVFPVFVFINTLWLQDFRQLATNSYVFGGTFTLLVAVFYLWQLYSSDLTDNIFRDPILWISLGYVFYCAVSVPYLGMLNDLWKKYPVFTRDYYFIMYDGAIIFNRISLSIAFLCMLRSPNNN